MKLKTKLFASLFVVLMLGMTTSAFADLLCNVTTTPVPREVLNSHWANTGDLTFTCTAPNNNPTTEASITIFYSGMPIVNDTTLASGGGAPFPPGHVISVTVTAGNALTIALDATRVDTGTTGRSQTGSLVAVLIPALAQPQGTCAPTCTFTVSNVLLSLATLTVNTPIAANINVVSQSGNVVLTGSPILIIGSVLPYLNTTTNPPALATGTTAAVFTSAGVNPPASASCNAACQNARATFSVIFTEDHIDTWRSNTGYYQNGQGVTGNGTNVVYTFSGMLPGSAISNCVLTATSGTWTLTGSGIAGVNNQTTLVAEIVNGTASPNQSVLDALNLTCGTSTTNPAFLPGASSGVATTPVTVTASAWPVGVAIPSGPGTNALTGGYPRYASGGAVGPVTVINFIGGTTGQTTMLIPFVTASGAAAPPAGTFNTGVTIANTTKDPAAFGTDAQGAAVDTAGNVTFYFFPADGSASFTIAPTGAAPFPITGLVNGVVPAGGTLIANFSEILKSGGQTGSFSGYVFVITNFTHAHGTAFVYGGGAADRLTSFTPVLTLGNPAISSRNTNFGFPPNVENTGL